jgi:anthranilate 1,2-dioxygenase large subunit
MQNEASPSRATWPAGMVSRVPYWIYVDRALYERELETMFYGPTWNYVGCIDEVAAPGDYKRAWIGERSVILVRDEDGALSVVENACAHRGTQLVWCERGHGRRLTCPYHQWSFSLKGDLVGVPFRRGLNGAGGYDADFDPAHHGLRRLRHVERHGLVWASFAEDAPDLEDYFAEALPGLDRVFSRKVRVLGYQRQMLPCNWKLYIENLRDPYHATLLHTFYVTFGLLRAGNRFLLGTAAGGAHSVTVTENSGQRETDATGEIDRFGTGLRLEDPAIVTPVPDFADGRVSGGTLHPSSVMHQQANSIAIRHLVPKGPHESELIWTFFGYADDDEAMTERRVKQANLFGPAGLVSIDDTEVLKFVQSNAVAYHDHEGLFELGGRGTSDGEHMLSESQIRAFYAYYRGIMAI